MHDNDPGPARDAWREFVEVLRDCDESFISPQRGEFDEREMAFGYRNLTHIVSFAIDQYMYGEPDHPTFLRTKTHSHGYVPFALCGSGVTADGAATYDEVTAAASPIRLDRGCELMPLLFRDA